MRTCLHCLAEPTLPNSVLGEQCAFLPRCEVCTVFLDGLVSASEANPRRCDDCVAYEDRIKLKCIFCPAILPMYMDRKTLITRFKIRGNTCGSCSRIHEDRARAIRSGGAKPKYEGYLALMHNQHLAGKLGTEAWEELQLLHPHDINDVRDNH
jgi:hypothetical protein